MSNNILIVINVEVPTFCRAMCEQHSMQYLKKPSDVRKGVIYSSKSD